MAHVAPTRILLVAGSPRIWAQAVRRGTQKPALRGGEGLGVRRLEPVGSSPRACASFPSATGAVWGPHSAGTSTAVLR